MKKMITLLLVLTGMVTTASATDYIVSGDAAIVKNGHSWYYEDNDNLLTETTTSGIYTLVVEGCSLTKDTNYGFKVKVNENTWNDGTTFPSSNYDINVPETGTYTLIYYVDIANKNIRVIATPMLRWSLGNSGSGNWTWLYDSDAFFTKNGDFTWTFEVSSAEFTSDFSFRIFSAVFKKSAYPGSQDLVLTYGGDASTSAYFNTAESTDYSWKFVKPSYDINKVKITAVYNPFADDQYGTWTVSADAYVPVTTNNSGYATFVHPQALTISGATAYVATDNNNGSATATAITNPAATTPMLIKGTPSTTYYFAVAASGTDYSSTNAFHAGTGAALGTNEGGGYNYILNGNGFYLAAGQTVGANKAYLKLSTQAAGRALIFEDEDVTGINTVTTATTEAEVYYNLVGQRIDKPTKGLYIVGGKKVIVK